MAINDSGAVSQILQSTFNLSNGGVITNTGMEHTGNYGLLFNFSNVAGQGNITATGTGNQITADRIGIHNGATITTNAASDLTITSIIKDNPNFVSVINKAGAGTLILTGANTYTGATTINAGELRFAAPVNQTLSGSVTGAGALTQSGNSMLTLSNATVNFSGTTTVNRGVLNISNATASSSTTWNIGVDYGATAPAATGLLVFGKSLDLTGKTLSTVTASGVAASSTAYLNPVLALQSGNTGSLTVTAPAVPNQAIVRVGNTYFLTHSTLDSYVWSNAATGTATDGVGTWDAATTASWRTTSGSPGTNVNWGGGANIANFGVANGAAGTVTVNGTVNTGGLAFNPAGSGTYTLANGTSGLINFGANNGLLSANGTDATINVGLTGTNGLTKQGTGVLTLGAANTVSGALAVNGGTLTLKDTNTFSGVTVNAGTLTADLGTTAGAKTFFGAGPITVNSGATLRFFAGSTSNAMSHANAINLNNATFRSEDAVQTYSGDIALTGSNRVDVVFTAKDAIFSGALSGAGSLNKIGAGTLILSGANGNTFTGPLTAFQGAVTFAKTGGAKALGGDLIFDNNLSPDVYTTVDNQFVPGAVVSFVNDAGDHGRFDLMGTTQTVAGIQTVGYTTQRGVIQNSEAVPNTGSSTLVLNGSGNYTFTGFLRNQTGTLGLTKSGTGTQTLVGNQISYTGATTYSGGSLILQDTTAFASAMTVSAGRTLQLVRTANGFGNRAKLTGLVSGAGTIDVNSPTPGIAGGWVTLNGAAVGLSAFTGTVNVNSGVLAMDNLAGVFTGNPNLNVASGGLFAIRGQDISVNSLTGSGDVFNSNTTGGAAGKTLTVGAANGSGIFSGVIHGSIGTGGTDGAIEQGVLNLVKAGSGTQTLSGASTYTGSTSVRAGTLQLDFAAGGTNDIINASSALVLGGGTLELRGGSTEANTQTFNGVSGAGGVLKLTQNGAASINATLGAITANGVNFVGSDATAGALGNLNFLTSTTTTGDDGSTRLGSSLWNGTDWASTSSTGGNHVVQWTGTYAGLTTNQGNLTNPTGDLKITDGGAAGTATTYGANTTINSLLMVAPTFATTVDIGSGFTLTVGAGASPVNAAVAVSGNSLTIGSVVGQGKLTAGDSGASTLSLTNYNGASTLAVNSVVADNAGAGAVSLSTLGNVVLNAANTYTGGTTIGGVLQIAGTGTLGNGNYLGAISNGATLRYSSSTDQILAGVISGVGGVTKDTANSTLTLSNTNTYTGPTVINAGTLELKYAGNVNTTANSASYTIASGSTLKLNNTSTTVNTAAPTWSKLTGAGTLLLASSKTFDTGWGTPALPSSFTGTLQIEGGRVVATTAVDNGLGGTSSIVIKNGGHLGTFSGGTFNQNFTIAGVGYGEGGGFNGAIRFANGGLTTTINGSVTLAGNTTLVAGTGGFGVINGNISDSTLSNLTIGDTGAVAGTILLKGANTYTGVSTAAFGTMQFGQKVALYNNNQASWTATNLVANSGATAAFNVGGTGEFTVADIDILKGLGTASGGFKAGSFLGLDTTNAPGATFAYNSVIGDTANPLGIHKIGTGTLTLSPANTYTGATKITGGILSVDTLANGGVASNIGASTNAAGNLILGGGTLQYTGGTVTTDRAFTINANSTLEVTGAGTTLNINNAAAVSGNGAAILTKTGPGTLTLGGTLDNASFLLAVSSGEVDLNKGVAANVRAVAGIASVASGATVKLTGLGTDQIFGGSITANFGLNNLAGTLDLNGHSESTSNFSGSASGLVTNSNAAGVVFTVGETNANNNTFAGVIQNGAGTVALRKIGTGLQILSGANTYSGGTVISVGTLQLNAAASAGTGLITLGDGSTGTNAVRLLANAGSATFANNITVSASGTGTATIEQGQALSTLSGLITLNRATTITHSGTDRAGISGKITGNVGTLTFTGTRTTMDNSVAHDFVGNIVISSGALQTNTMVNCLPITASLTINGTSIFQLNNGLAQRIDALNGGTTATTGVQIIAGGATTLTIGAGNSNGSFAGNIVNNAATLSITKAGTGTQTFSGANTYTGATTVNGGTLKLDFVAGGTSNIISASSALSLNGGTLEIAGGASEANTQTFASTSGVGGTLKLTPGTATSINATLGLVTANGVNFVGSNATVGALGTLNFLTGTTTTPNDGTIRLGASLWNGADWASTSVTGGNHVVQWTGTYTPLTTNQGDLTNPIGDLKVTNGGAGGTATTYGASTTINSLLMAATSFGTTVDIASGFTLTVGSGATPTNAAVAIGSSGSSLTIGSVVGQGTLTAGASGASTLNLANYNAASTLTVNSVIGNNAGAGAVSLASQGNVVLNATNTYTGPTSIAGNLQIAGTGSLNSGNYAGAINNSGQLRYSSSVNQILSGAISGSGSLLLDGTGMVTLATANTYTGGTTVNGGILKFTNVNQLPGPVSIGGSGTVNLAPTGTTNAVANAFTGTGLIKFDMASVGTAGNSTFSGIREFAGTIQLATATTTGDKFRADNQVAPNASLIVGNNTQLFVAAPQTFKAVSLIGTGNNENRGAIRLSNALTVVNGIALQGNATIGGEGGSLTGGISTGVAGTSTLTFGTGASNIGSTINGVISDGTGILALTNATGTLNLPGANTYTGATTINGGTVLVNGSLSGSSAVAVNNGGTLGGTNGSLGAATVNAGGTFSPGAASALGTLNLTSLAFNGTGTFKLEINTSTLGADRAVLSGNLTLGATAPTLTVTDLGSNVALAADTKFTFITYAGTWDTNLFTFNSLSVPDDSTITVGLNSYFLNYNDSVAGLNAVTLTVVPEPGAFVSLLGGVGVLLGLRRRRH